MGTRKHNILFLGCRSGALRAAHAMGHKTFAVAKTLPLNSVRGLLAGFTKADFTSGMEALQNSVKAALGKTKPDAIIALTEETVVPAARLREALGLLGPSLHEAQRCHNKVLMKQAVL